ncbi:MAG: glycine--tRNA ligase subunit beta [Desmonostoc vinosum HA7617-LM4]|jgi:glycyl-tRNA synthetase beta chain|nr:glycine--tRNA ligase subunit beta [Desmonostoc vinosum HA7617-LM4]
MSTFLLEVGTEELPASFLSAALVQWRSRIPQSLEANSLSSDSIEVYGTPRRLAILIKNLPSQQSDREEEVKGPPAQAAFKDGKPTPAAVGFAKKQGVELDALEVRPTDKGEFVFVRKKIAGRPVAEILTELVPQWILGLEGKRLMRWSDGDVKFSRPIRWLVALLDDAVLPIELVNGSETIYSDRISQGHRVLHPEPVTISHATDYVTILSDAYVMVNADQRAQMIQEQVKSSVQTLNGYAQIYPHLLEEVTNLVEWPSPVIGRFEAEFLNLPTEVITTVMVSHQRYFPVFKAADAKELLPYFITISNGDAAKSDIIALGNERVIRARLADGRFFYEADVAKPLESFLPQLETVTFQEDLGSLRAKVERIGKIAEQITAQLQLEANQRHKIQRAALLCKADLVTQMVFEFPELQGIMGQKYALASNEDAEVATAIFEHYLPKGADDILPETLTGQIVGIADRLDTLVSIFGLGMLPTGSSDPFALRRAANAIINITWSANLPLNLENLLAQIATDFVIAHNDKDKTQLIAALQEFFLQRIRTLLQEEKQIDYDLVNAVLGENDPEYTQRALADLLDVRDRALYLQQIRNDSTLDNIYETVNRSTRLATQGNLDTKQLEPTAVVNPELFQKPSEGALYSALVDLEPETQAAQKTRNYQLLVAALTKIAPTVSNFFDGPDSVLVMDADPQIKQNRLHLLGLIRNHARVLADFGAIVKNL